MLLYHGSNTYVENPKIITDGFNKDFGFGFYLTTIENQAKKWALTKRGEHIVNVYEYVRDDKLKLVEFSEMTEEWLDFIVSCRMGKKHEFDIVEGPMADDKIWNYIEDYVSGLITREAFWELSKFRHPTHQIAFCSNEALACIKYIKGYKV